MQATKSCSAASLYYEVRKMRKTVCVIKICAILTDRKQSTNYWRRPPVHLWIDKDILI